MDINKIDQNKIELKELQKHLKIEDYNELYTKIVQLIDKNQIKPIKSSKTNGKKPSLYNRYTLIKKDNTKDYTDEILYKINTKLDISRYLKNQKLYEKNREYILMLSNFLDNNTDKLNTRISINERSFQIFGREKFISKEGGKTLLKSLNIDIELLNIYETTEPLAYYSNNKKTPQNILIIENKDTFYSMRRFIMKNDKIFDTEISTVIYGGGKSIYKSFNDFEFYVEDYLLHKDNKLIYLGDLDYEGILIYENLAQIFENKFNITPFTKGYIAMIQKYKAMNIELPLSSENQNKNIRSNFIESFDDNTKTIIKEILDSKKYIPQEILNIEDF